MSGDERSRRVVHAAGGVLWRKIASGDDAEVEVGVVHRPRYDDWSLPKGHVEPDENPVVGGLREVTEETGFTARLIRAVGKVDYDVPRRPKNNKSDKKPPVGRKFVTYWSALAHEGNFVPNSETDDLQWHPVTAAEAMMTYPTDRRILRRFAAQPTTAATMLIVRHAKAGRKQGYRGADISRPLDKSGRAQAEALTDLCRAFAPGELISAPPVRCLQTLELLSEDTGMAVSIEDAFSERAYDRDPKAAHRRIRDLARAGEDSSKVPVLCSQGGVIPGLMEWWAKADGVRLPAARNRKASVWVVTTADGRLLTADHIDTPLPLEH